MSDDETKNETVWVAHKHCQMLDGVRGLAILAVTFYRLAKEFDSAGHPALATVRRFAPIGERGVDLFFVLSGFLITGILLHSRGKPNYFRNFIVRRALRIFPLYFLSLVIGLWIIPRAFDTHVFDIPRAEQFYLWTYTSNIRMSWLNDWCFGPFDHFWSLAVEEHFYFVWPAVVLLVRVRRLASICIAIIVVVAIARILAAMNTNLDVAVDVLTIFRMDALAMGALLASILHKQTTRLPIRSLSMWVMIVTLPSLACIAIVGNRLLGIPSTLCPIFFTAGPAWLLVGSRASPWTHHFESWPLRQLGKYSYGIYVVQLPIVTLCALSACSVFLPNHPILQAIAYFVTIFVLIVLVAFLSFHLLESHFLKLKRLFP